VANVHARRPSERRSEHLLNDLLDAQGWDRRRPPQGDVLFQSEYRGFPELVAILKNASKSGTGAGIPEALLIDRVSNEPLGVVEAKPLARSIGPALAEAQAYAAPFIAEGFHPLAIGLAGAGDTDFELRVTKWTGSEWVFITYDGNPIGWIPTLEDIGRIAAPTNSPELRPSMPPQEVLAARAEEINRLLRESDIRDEYRPAVVAAIMVALWQAGRTGGTINRDPRSILRDINSYCSDAFGAKKFKLANSLRIDPANEKLAKNARRIVAILDRLNIAVLTAEHDYLGQLYETFFRYTGGNTIGQYFTPRHITALMAELTDIGVDDITLDPACGSGGFLIAAMDRMLKLHGMKRDQMVGVVAQQLIGFESEPVTAALCVANMILRGDGSTGIHQADALTSREFPKGTATVALLNPPFPHKKTDTPAEAFIDKALEGLADGGRLAVIMPTSAMVRKDKGTWRARTLKRNRLDAIIQLPDELFQPYAAATTSIALLTKGKPHDPKRKTVFVRLHHDGFVLRKKARVRRTAEPDQAALAIDAVRNMKVTPGFAGVESISGSDEWAVGAYIPAAPPEEPEFRVAVDVLLRRLASFYTRYAPEVLAQRQAIEDTEIEEVEYLETLSRLKLNNAMAITGAPDEIGGRYHIVYGLGALESREGIPPGKTLVISPTERYNGCDDWLDFPTVLKPPFITVARTGSIGEAFVHLEPCAPNSDCLVLIPKKDEWASVPELLLAASAIRLERWRYNYGRKITPSRLANVKVGHSESLKDHAADLWRRFDKVIKASLQPYVMPEAPSPAPETKKGRADTRIAMPGVDPVAALRAFMQVDPRAIAAREEADPDDEEDIADALAALKEPGGATWVDIKAARGL
jgi:type I restriction enzyme M protein